MERVDYLGGLRRRGYIIVAAVAVGMLGAWLTRSVGASTSERFEAGTPLLGSTDPTITNLATLAALTTLGEVPGRVATSLDYEGDPANLARRVVASPDQGTGILWIVAAASTAQGAERLANAFARELVDWVDDSRRASSEQAAKRLEKEINKQERGLERLGVRTDSRAVIDPATLTPAQNAALQQYTALLAEQLAAVTDPVLAPSPLSILQPAAAAPIKGDELLGPLSTAGRLAVGGALGLVAGLALALVLERFDRRIRTKAGAERSFRLPVLAEIPSLGRRERRAIVDDEGRLSPALQPFRLLAAQLGAGGPPTGGPGGNGHRAPPGQLLLVTSPGSREGKSRVVGSLAASYAETGRKVLVVSCDLQRPLVHKLLRAPDEPGLSDALMSGNGRGLIQPVAQSTPLPNLKVIPSGHPTDNASRLISSDRMLRVLDEAREAADVVVVDAAPLLAGGEAASLIAEADAVLLVASAGRTTVDEAERSAELLERLDAPVAGVALTANA